MGISDQLFTSELWRKLVWLHVIKLDFLTVSKSAFLPRISTIITCLLHNMYQNNVLVWICSDNELETEYTAVWLLSLPQVKLFSCIWNSGIFLLVRCSQNTVMSRPIRDYQYLCKVLQLDKMFIKMQNSEVKCSLQEQ